MAKVMVPYVEIHTPITEEIAISTEEPVHPEGEGFILYWYSEVFGELRFLNLEDEYGKYSNFLEANRPGELAVDRWAPTRDVPLASIWGY